MIGFVYSSLSVGFRAMLMLFLSSLSQKIFSEELLIPGAVLSRGYPRKCSIGKILSLENNKTER